MEQKHHSDFDRDFIKLNYFKDQKNFTFFIINHRYLHGCAKTYVQESVISLLMIRLQLNCCSENIDSDIGVQSDGDKTEPIIVNTPGCYSVELNG
jgi:hypothetical protein